MRDKENLSPLGHKLRRFNRKERYWLLENILEHFSESKINQGFKKFIASELAINIPERGVYWAFDYHFDWIYAAVASNADLDEDTVYENSKELKIRGTQQDIDFLICFDETLILIEAKGVTGWKEKQFLEKVERIKELKKHLYAKIGAKHKIYFFLMSPKDLSKKFQNPLGSSEEIPSRHIRMQIDDDLVFVRRCDKDGKDYHQWKIIPSATNRFLD